MIQATQSHHEKERPFKFHNLNVSKGALDGDSSRPMPHSTIVQLHTTREDAMPAIGCRFALSNTEALH